MNEDKTTNVSRRDFLRTSASGVVAATALLNTRGSEAVEAAPLVNPRIIGANDRIRIGIVGVKGMGGGHLRNLVGPDMVNDNQEVVAVCDLWETARQRAQVTARLPDASVYSDYRRLLENKDIDAVVVATPDHWHGRIGVDALLAGKTCTSRNQ